MSMSIVSPFLMALLLVWALVGIVMLYRGWRGAPTLSEPRCAKCGYDLRGFAGAPPTVCTECGSDLGRPHAIRWGANRRRPRLMWTGAAVAAIPLLLVAAMAVGASFGVRPGQIPRSNSAVIASLRTTANQPWEWQELQRRYRSGALSNEEAARAIDQLIASLAASPRPGQQPLHWADDFLEQVDRAGAVSDEQYARLAQAFYGTKPLVRVSRTAKHGTRLRFSVDFGGSWNLPGVEVVKALRAVKLADGRELALRTEYDAEGPKPNPDRFSGGGAFPLEGKVLLDLQPGEHTLTFVVDAGVLKSGTLPQVAQGQPGQARHWPRGRARWTMEVPVRVKVVPAGESPVTLVTDAEFDPQKGGIVKVTRAATVRTDTGPRLMLDLEFGRLPVAVSFDVIARVAGQEVPLGGHVRSEEGRSWQAPHAHTFDALPPDVKSLDVILRPNPAHAENVAGVDRIWGGEIELKNVRLERHDLDTADSQPAK